MIDKIEERRQALGITQRALCKAARLHPTTYSQLKNNRRDSLSGTIGKLNAALDALAEKARAAG